ncbi:MAG: hypothetical protein H0T80_21350 [Betaproteobacteria bacterium]|nr:hypothetical protein [Betaproteobacteria bacterium]
MLSPAQPEAPVNSDQAVLDALQRASFDYFLCHANPGTGLIADTSAPGSPASIAASGMGLAVYLVGAERGFMTRADAAQRTLALLRFLEQSEQSEAASATGVHGLYYHFLEMETGRRAWASELSTIDTALLFAGILAAAAYFDGDASTEQEIRALADALYRRADWRWAMNGSTMVKHGWKPDSGFLNYGWEGYSEAIILYALGLGSPTHPLPPPSYLEWTATFQWENLYGWDLLYSGALFIHQFSHLWLDFRGIQDQFMREKRCDYFENSRRASYVHQHYAILNPKQWTGYGRHCWGISAGEGPGFVTRRQGSLERRYFDYTARGLPYGPDDGTLAPWAVAASLPFAPEIVLPTLRYLSDVYPQMQDAEKRLRSFNPSFSVDGVVHGWVAEHAVAIEQAPIVLMIENDRSGLLWRLGNRCEPLATGLRRAGFRGGWL